MTIASLYERVQRLNTNQVIEEAFEDTAADFADKQREQLTDGFGSDGDRLRKYRNRAYARKKNAMNPKPGYGNPDLKLTGAFHRGIFMTVNGDKVLTGSLDQKGPNLEAKYPAALGLAPGYKGEYLADSLSPVIKRKIGDILGLKFG